METLCLLGCGNLGAAILNSLLGTAESKPLFSQFVACVRSEASVKKLADRYPQHQERLTISRGDNINAVRQSDVIILGVDPADIDSVLKQHGLREVLEGKLLISIAAGWTRQKLEEAIYGSETTDGNKLGRAWVIRTLPNIAAQVSQSLTAIEVSEPSPPEHYLTITTAIFERIGRAVQIEPRHMNATTAVGGSTPAFFAVICDALIDAAVAVGVPRHLARTMIIQSMLGTATVLQGGMHPAVLRDQGTSPEGCTIGGLMVMEEAGVRGHVGRALREAVTLARLMETTEHVNDTRH
ncbi:uncharacterized protein N7482_004938 [Penicillium canariense]|uniref:Pyrroline-5-carboxylate reductase n=1 Tax=Penicillium canariense TaxID=189055 RepID=A0A9W9I716_9EURO|nr:uncharacterized protein N7482_004938 [Penicillium canariense]KAJ5166157.1 hypothetical protein N7482_004938 [Penicillium canariense]